MKIRMTIPRLMHVLPVVLLVAMVGATGFAQSSSTCVSPHSGLIGWWPGDGNANDIIGNNNGTAQNGGSFVDGKVGHSFSLDGVNDYFRVEHATSLNLAEHTIETWIQPLAQVGASFEE